MTNKKPRIEGKQGCIAALLRYAFLAFILLCVLPAALSGALLLALVFAFGVSAKVSIGVAILVFVPVSVMGTLSVLGVHLAVFERFADEQSSRRRGPQGPPRSFLAEFCRIRGRSIAVLLILLGAIAGPVAHAMGASSTYIVWGCVGVFGSQHYF